MTTAKAKDEQATEAEVADPKAEREARKAEAHAAALSLRDYERGYEEVQWSGRTLYRPLGGGDRMFDTAREAEEHVAASRVQANLSGGVGA